MKDELKELRIKYDLSQADLACEIGISVDSIRRWEQGYPFKPTKRTAAKLQRFVNKLTK